MKCRNCFQMLMIISVLLFITGCNNSGKYKTIETGVQTNLVTTLDAVLEANLNADGPGLIVSVWQNDKNLYTGMKGVARPMQPISEDTQFRLASVSKTFTAVAILKLYEQGLLGLHDSIVDYLPELDSSWQEISIHHLLTHQSGIPDIFNDLNTHEVINNDITNPKILQYFIENHQLEFGSGRKEEYSNTGYILLAEIITKVANMPFPEFMDLEIFAPLNMNNTYILDEDVDITERTAMNHAQHHQIYGRNVFAVGSSSQVSSMHDMERFMYALMAGKILQAETMRLMLKAHISKADSSLNGTGYGIFYFSGDGKTAYGHSGKHDGFRTIYAINRDKNAFIIMLGNGGDYMPDFTYVMDLAGEFLE
ncbi:serine hydrolase domain-containing protein [Pseudoalteromonas aurantia]|nr:serine hydrolase domain-containing protein [Pseudoalteromonas aurantia]